MKLLLDTHLLLWAITGDDRLSAQAKELIDDDQNELHFSVVNIWETAIKHNLGRQGFLFHPRNVRRQLLEQGFREIEISSEHAIAAGELPRLHRDPFDRLLIAQATVEDAVLLTSDAAMTRYSGSICLV
jgi:PIN domain nuclease of toxin-antitoxin system